ncbi:hypothetical protein CBR_g54841 [Chara braunii]|uniref:Reverse transcriptase RNase H-like domain-containing protein n=1 Tax=Chara braunii TaxID=69332 RepID=A0A388JPP5_CHABU|nr:hypothetical protein CBR_g54841 [Chara braunii]|eukprot:GBG59738.1 hypothetical protein CBR_g54841 [Chara braunii]
MVTTRGGTSTTPYCREQEEQVAALLKERKEKLEELIKQAKMLALIEEQKAKQRQLEERKWEKEQEEIVETIDGEAEVEAEKGEKEEEVEVPLERNVRREERGEPNVAPKIRAKMEKMVTKVGALIDSGATRSYISRGALKKLKLNLKVQKLDAPIVGILADNRTMRIGDYVEGVQAYFRLEQDGKVERVIHSLTLLVEDNLSFDMVLGMDWGEATRATLHLREHKCRLPSPSGGVKTARLFHVSGVDNPLAHWCLSAPAFARLVKEQLEKQLLSQCSRVRTISEGAVRKAGLRGYVKPITEPNKEEPTNPLIAKLLEEYADLSEAPSAVVPRRIQHRIEIEPGSNTPKGAVYRMSSKELEELRKQLDELLEKGWIRPSSSPFGAHVLFVPKKVGEMRMCIDYKGLNAVTQDDGNGYIPVEFMSARLPSKKVATSTYERELYALRQALDHWRHYLLGRHFKVYSDHETLRWLRRMPR